MRVAILVDAGFFLKRYNRLVKNGKDHSPQQVAECLHKWACDHVPYDQKKSETNELYRIFVYDCGPFTGNLHHPLTKELVKFGSSPVALFRTAFHERLTQLRKVALRLGSLSDVRHWAFKADVMQDLIKGKRDLDSITENDVVLDVKQKGVDMRIGVDVASLAFKRQVDRIVLVAGDADFIPAAKLARREGIDFVLDSMHAKIASSLYEHIDGLVSQAPRPEKAEDGTNPHKGYSYSFTPPIGQWPDFPAKPIELGAAYRAALGRLKAQSEADRLAKALANPDAKPVKADPLKGAPAEGGDAPDGAPE